MEDLIVDRSAAAAAVTVVVQDEGGPRGKRTPKSPSAVGTRTTNNHRDRPIGIGIAQDLSTTTEEEPWLRRAIAESSLPAHYNFEVVKTIRMIRKHGARRVALQMPEGLLMFATTIATLLETCSYVQQDGGGDGTSDTSPADTADTSPVDSRRGDDVDVNVDSRRRRRTLETVILADVTYGACCVDDFTAKALECDLLVHYGHSCLVPVTSTSMPTLYVFVDIQFPVDHLLRSIPAHFPPALYADRKIFVVGTIQFAATLPLVCRHLRDAHGYRQVNLPQERPLSPGEILGCTSPKLPDADLIIYVGDGRFHLESIMLANPQLTEKGEVYRYDPYTRKFTREHYAYQETMRMRKQAIEQVREVLQSSASTPTADGGTTDNRHDDDADAAETWVGVLWGTLGRQGSPSVVRHLQQRIRDQQRGGGGGGNSSNNVHVLSILLSEISPQRLALFQPPPSSSPSSGGHVDYATTTTIDAWIQTSCPRLSVDWGYAFDRPLLSPYEAVLALLPAQEYRARMPGWMRALEGGGGQGEGEGGGQPSSAMATTTACSASSSSSSSSSSCSATNATTTADNFTFPQHTDYPMDFYSKTSLGPWTPNHGHGGRDKKVAGGSGNGAAGGSVVGGQSWKQRLEAKRRRQQQQQQPPHDHQQQHDQQQRDQETQ